MSRLVDRVSTISSANKRREVRKGGSSKRTDGDCSGRLSQGGEYGFDPR
jgi:hypothetical protein